MSPCTRRPAHWRRTPSPLCFGRWAKALGRQCPEAGRFDLAHRRTRYGFRCGISPPGADSPQGGAGVLGGRDSRRARPSSQASTEFEFGSGMTRGAGVDLGAAVVVVPSLLVVSRWVSGRIRRGRCRWRAALDSTRCGTAWSRSAMGQQRVQDQQAVAPRVCGERGERRVEGACVVDVGEAVAHAQQDIERSAEPDGREVANVEVDPGPVLAGVVDQVVGCPRRSPCTAARCSASIPIQQPGPAPCGAGWCWSIRSVHVVHVRRGRRRRCSARSDAGR